jgi:Zn-dependent protease
MKLCRVIRVTVAYETVIVDFRIGKRPFFRGFSEDSAAQSTILAMEQLSPEFLALGLIWYIVFLFSTTCHEASHALAAKLGGDPTAFHGGQVTLNPVPHVQREPFGMVLVPILSYVLGGWMIGWASAPYDPWWQERHPRRAALMSLAGPGANFVLMLLAAICIRAGIGADVFQPPASASFGHIIDLTDPQNAGPVARFASTFLSVLFFENLLLGTFNLLPVPPLDGGTGVTLFMSERLALRFLSFTREPTFQMAGLVASWYLFDKAFSPIFTLALNILYPGLQYS